MRAHKGSCLRGANSLCRTRVCLLSLGEELAGGAAQSMGGAAGAAGAGARFRGGRAGVLLGAPTLEFRPGKDGFAGIDGEKARSGCPGQPRGTGNLFKWAERAALPHPRDGACWGDAGDVGLEGARLAEVP